MVDEEVTDPAGEGEDADEEDWDTTADLPLLRDLEEATVTRAFRLVPRDEELKVEEEREEADLDAATIDGLDSEDPVLLLSTGIRTCVAAGCRMPNQRLAERWTSTALLAERTSSQNR